MTHRLADLAGLVGGRVEGDPDREVEAVRTLEAGLVPLILRQRRQPAKPKCLARNALEAGTSSTTSVTADAVIFIGGAAP